LADALRLGVAFALAFVLVVLATPAAIRLARRTSFFDRPVGYKRHL
jgi:UDP-N-acetylmuramyl pentapeptide phosphotransferase/UDP-N-acetylglucosamine-1-phosphate transferase